MVTAGQVNVRGKGDYDASIAPPSYWPNFQPSEKKFERVRSGFLSENSSARRGAVSKLVRKIQQNNKMYTQIKNL